LKGARDQALLALLYVFLQAPVLPTAVYHDDTYNSRLYLKSAPLVATPPAGTIADPRVLEWGRDWGRQLHIHPPLLSIVYFSWIRVFGDGETSLHLPTAMAGLAALLLWHRVALRVVDRETALWAGVLFCLSPPALYYSSRAIHASFESLAFAASVLALARHLEAPGPRRLAVLLGCNVLGALTAYHYLVLLALQAALAWRLRSRLGGSWRLVALPACGTVAIAAALLAGAGRFGYRYDHWWQTRPSQIPRFFAAIPVEVAR
jgi:hypothetical protein